MSGYLIMSKHKQGLRWTGGSKVFKQVVAILKEETLKTKEANSLINKAKLRCSNCWRSSLLKGYTDSESTESRRQKELF